MIGNKVAPPEGMPATERVVFHAATRAIDRALGEALALDLGSTEGLGVVVVEITDLRWLRAVQGKATVYGSAVVECATCVVLDRENARSLLVFLARGEPQLGYLSDAFDGPPPGLVPCAYMSESGGWVNFVPVTSIARSAILSKGGDA